MACGGKRPVGRKKEDFVGSEGPLWDVVLDDDDDDNDNNNNNNNYYYYYY